MPRIRVGGLISGETERLAREARSENVHESAKRLAWKALNIRPDRSWIQLSRFHFCDQVCHRVGFDLRSSDEAQARDDSPQSEMNAAVSCAPFHKSDFGIIHIQNRG